MAAQVVMDRELQILTCTVESAPSACLCLPSRWWSESVFWGPSCKITFLLLLDQAQHSLFFAVTPFLSLSPVYPRVCAHVKLPFPSQRKVE